MSKAMERDAGDAGLARSECEVEGLAGFVDRVLQAREEITDLGITERIGEPLLLGLADLFLKIGPSRG